MRVDIEDILSPEDPPGSGTFGEGIHLVRSVGAEVNVWPVACRDHPPHGGVQRHEIRQPCYAPFPATTSPVQRSLKSISWT